MEAGGDQAERVDRFALAWRHWEWYSGRHDRERRRQRTLESQDLPESHLQVQPPRPATAGTRRERGSLKALKVFMDRDKLRSESPIDEGLDGTISGKPR